MIQSRPGVVEGRDVGDNMEATVSTLEVASSA